MDLVLDLATYLPHQEVTGTVPSPGTLSLFHLGVLRGQYEVGTRFNLGLVSQGSYSLRWKSGAEQTETALEVLSDPWDRLRYGFIAEFGKDVAVHEYLEWAKELHLTSVQFYDWAYRHEFLVGDQAEYGDPLGRTVSLPMLEALITGYKNIGTVPSGYAAVYAVDAEGWERWRQLGLFNSEGKPYQLGENFLWIVDPASPKWLAHFTRELEKAHQLGFTAFHLDQYGWPKIAKRGDGEIIDLSTRFSEMLNHFARELPNTKHIFNNVNDFPTWSTALADQDATYIEVWDPHSSFQDLADLVAKARGINPTRPIILSAYLKPFNDLDGDPDLDAAEAAFELTFASIVSGGASHLIAGGAGQVLFDPYYVRNHKAQQRTKEVIKRNFNFTVSAGDLLYDSTRSDVTLTASFGINTEIQFESSLDLSPSAQPGNVWVRVFSGASGLTIHFINLLDQKSTTWDEGKSKILSSGGVTVSIDSVGFQSQASMGGSKFGSVFSAISARQENGRFKFDLNLDGAWCILNISRT